MYDHCYVLKDLFNGICNLTNIDFEAMRAQQILENWPFLGYLKKIDALKGIHFLQPVFTFKVGYDWL